MPNGRKPDGDAVEQCRAPGPLSFAPPGRATACRGSIAAKALGSSAGVRAWALRGGGPDIRV
jgi:hypothetical protein